MAPVQSGMADRGAGRPECEQVPDRNTGPDANLILMPGPSWHVGAFGAINRYGFDAALGSN
jgi:hypothetical protein